MKWIKASEQLPELGDARYVQVYIYGPELALRDCQIPGWLKHQCTALFDGREFWVLSCPQAEVVTHWMPLPEPPDD